MGRANIQIHNFGLDCANGAPSTVGGIGGVHPIKILIQ